MQITDEQFAAIEKGIFAASLEIPYVQTQHRMGYGDDCVSASFLVRQAADAIAEIHSTRDSDDK